MAAPLLWAVLVPESKVLPPVGGQKNQKLSRDYSDEPIATEEQDLLDRRDFARHLADEIVALPGRDSFVFGLIARWGEGKTSVLNMVKRKLEGCPETIIIDFNPWYFASEIGILEAFYGSIERAVEARFLLPSFKRLIRRYLKTLSIGLDHKPFNLELELPQNPERLRQELEGFIARTGARLVIFLDDIDRLDRDLALSALALTRLSARFRNTVFVLSIDADELKKKGIDQNFLEKIIQKQIMLPPAELRVIDEFFLYSDEQRASAIDWLLDSLSVNNERKSEFHKEMDPFYPEHLRSVFVTLCDVKRFLNALRASIAPVIDEVNLFDLFQLTILQVFEPHIYKDIWEHREFYVPRGFGFRGYRFSFLEGDAQARKEQVRLHVVELLKGSAERNDITEVLSSLFPDVALAFESILGQSRQQPRSHEQRLSDPLCFPKYFLGRIPAGQISDGEVRSIIRRWNGDGDGAISLVADDLERYLLRKQIQELVERVADFAGDIDSRQAEVIMLGLAEFTVRTKWDGEPDILSASALFSFAIATVSRSPRGLFPTVIELVRSGSIYFASGLVSWLSGRLAATVENTASLRAVMEKVEARLHEDFIEGGRDIFVDCPSSFQHILFWWATAWSTRPRSDEVENYVVKIVEKRPSDLDRLLAAFATSRDVIPDWFLQVGAVISLRKVVELLDRFGAKAVESDAAKSASALIRQAVAKASDATV